MKSRNGMVLMDMKDTRRGFGYLKLLFDDVEFIGNGVMALNWSYCTIHILGVA
jgi:hypothetical protein